MEVKGKQPQKVFPLRKLSKKVSKREEEKGREKEEEELEEEPIGAGGEEPRGRGG